MTNEVNKIEAAVVVDEKAVEAYLKAKWATLVAKVKPWATHAVAVAGGWIVAHLGLLSMVWKLL